MVLVPGFGLSHEAWDAQVRMLTDAGYRTVCIDPRGTGLSDKPLEGYEASRMAADVVAVIEHLDLRDATLVGWSFGGQACFGAAASVPERLSQLVLVASNAVRASRGEGFEFGRTPERLEEPAIEAELGDRVAARRLSIASGFAGDPPEHILDWLAGISLSMPSWAAVASYRSMFRSDLMGELGRVKLPVLQMFGTEDPVLSAKGARWLADQLGDSRIVELEGCGHFPMLEDPAAFDAALLEFVGQAPAGAD